MGEGRGVAWYNRPEERPVVRELVKLAEVGLTGLNAAKLDLPIVLEAARLIAPRSTIHSDLVNALLNVLFEAGGLVRGRTYRQAASLFLGHSDDTHGAPFGKRRQEAAKQFKQKPEGFRREDRGGQEAPLLRLVGKAIEDLISASKGLLALTDGGKRGGQYVLRPELEEAITVRLREAGRLFLVGDVGTGKSSVARHVARVIEQDPRLIVELDGQTHDRLLATTADALQRYARLIQGMSELDIQRAFVELLEDKDHAPTVVLFDNVDDHERLIGLLGIFWRQLHASVLFTSRTRPGFVTVESIDVPNLRPAEAQAMIRNRMPQCSIADAEMLADTLDNRPLAIEHSCAHLTEFQTATSDFCAALRHNTARMLENLGRPEQPTLTGIYRLVLASLNGVPSGPRFMPPRPTPAHNLLCLLTAWPHRSVDHFTAESHFGYNTWAQQNSTGSTEPVSHSDYPDIVPTQGVLAKVMLHRAIATLRHLCLLESVDDLLTMHRLTQDILRELLSDGEAHTFEESLLRAVGSPAYEYSTAKIQRIMPRALETLFHICQRHWLSDETLLRVATIANRLGRFYRETGEIPPELTELGRRIVVDAQARGLYLAQHTETPQSIAESPVTGVPPEIAEGIISALKQL